jgi:serine/threonine protein phosphatase PrpC
MNAHTSGSTMITLLLEKNGLLTCANVGDSRAILARQSKIFITKLIKKIGKLSIFHRTINHHFRKRRKGF